MIDGPDLVEDKGDQPMRNPEASLKNANRSGHERVILLQRVEEARTQAKLEQWKQDKLHNTRLAVKDEDLVGATNSNDPRQKQHS